MIDRPEFALHAVFVCRVFHQSRIVSDNVESGAKNGFYLCDELLVCEDGVITRAGFERAVDEEQRALFAQAVTSTMSAVVLSRPDAATASSTSSWAISGLCFSCRMSAMR